MFVGDEIMLDVAYSDARSGLIRLTHGGWLSDASSEAYAEGVAGLIRVGPFGEVLGASKLFRVLDANIILIPADENASQLALAGAYRPPFATVGEGLDRVLLHRAASATVHSLLRRIAQTIAPPQPEAGPGPLAEVNGTEPEPRA